MMKKKRLWAWFMAAVMAIGLLPVMALAEEAPKADPLKPNNVIVTTKDGTTELAELSKTAEDLGNGHYGVKLSVTAGDQKIETQPIEIVLVLDSSGSMAWCTDKNGHKHTKECYSCKMEEHEHWRGYGGCYNWKDELTCEKTPHKHNQSCTLTCGKVAHEHDLNWGGGKPCAQVEKDKESSRMAIVKKNAKAMINQLTEKAADTGVEIKVAVVDFDTNASTVCDLTSVTGDKNIKAIEDAIDDMEAEGGTWPDKGLVNADEVLKNGNPTAKKVVILLADGDANDNVAKNAAITKAGEIKKYAEIFTIGFATDADMLEKIATDNGANGYYATADTGADLSGIFTNIVNGLKPLISDPMGDLVKRFNVTQYPETVTITNKDGSVASTSSIGNDSWQNNSRLIKWSKADGLQPGQTVTITYTVELDQTKIKAKGVGEHDVYLNGDAKLNYSCGSEGGEVLFPKPKTTAKVGQFIQNYYVDDDTEPKATLGGDLVIVKAGDTFQCNTPYGEKYGTYVKTTDEAGNDITKTIYDNPSIPATAARVVVNHYYKTEPVVADAYYKVEYYKRALTADDYSLEETVPADGLSSAEVGTTVIATEKAFDGYCLNPKAEGYLASAQLTADDTESAPLVLKLYYDVDNNKDSIPDRYQKRVTFKVENGTWSDSKTADKIVYVELTDDNGKWNENGTGHLVATDIPTGMIANTDKTYDEGRWDVQPTTEIEIKEDVTFTYKFTPSEIPPVEDKVNLIYHSNYDTDKTVEQPCEKNKEATVAKDVFDRFGYDFVGWSENTKGTQMIEGDKVSIGEVDKDLYAIWKKQSANGLEVTKTLMGNEKVYKNGDKATFEIKIKNAGDETLYDLLLKETEHDGLKPVEHPWSFIADNTDSTEWLQWRTDGTDTTEANTALIEEPVAVEKPVTEELVAEENIVEAAENPLETLAEVYSNLAYLMKDEEGNTVVCIPELVPNGEYVLFYTVTVDIQGEYKKDDYTNIAIVEGEESNKETVPVTGINITKEVVGNTTVKRGDQVLYKIVVTNPSDFNLTNVTITEAPDAKLADGYFCDQDGKELTGNNVNGNEYTIISLEKDATETLYYTAKVSDNAANGEKLGNHVVIEAICGGDKVRDERDSEKVTVNVPGNNSSGGGSHRKHTSTKVEEVLNKEDHFQYVQGYPDATVRPDANITRAEATVIFFRLLTDSVREKYLDTENSFTDVSAADWFNLGISTMENGGFVNGYRDGSFRPNGYITRAELATIISNFDDLEPVEESKFPDAAGHWAEAYINSAAEKGWLSGYADGLFRPNQLITRAETMSMINRVLERSVDADGLHADTKQWQDNPIGKWYYYAVLEATNPHEYERKDTADVERWTAITAEKIWEN